MGTFAILILVDGALGVSGVSGARGVRGVALERRGSVSEDAVNTEKVGEVGEARMGVDMIVSLEVEVD